MPLNKSSIVNFPSTASIIETITEAIAQNVSVSFINALPIYKVRPTMSRTD